MNTIKEQMIRSLSYSLRMYMNQHIMNVHNEYDSIHWKLFMICIHYSIHYSIHLNSNILYNVIYM
jgi:hypothetical protein